MQGFSNECKSHSNSTPKGIYDIKITDTHNRLTEHQQH